MNKLYAFGGTIFSILCALFIYSPSVGAQAGVATNQLPADNTFLVVSNAGASAGSFSSPVSINYAYVPENETNARIEINNISSFIYSFRLGWVDVSGNCRDSELYGYENHRRGTPGQPRNGSTIPVNANNFSGPQLATIDRDGATYKIFCVVVYTNSTGIEHFKLISTGETLLGAYAGPDTSTGTGYFANSNAIWSSELSFATPCGGDIGVGNNRILLYDLDNGFSQRHINVTLRKYDRRPPGGDLGLVALTGDVDDLGSNVFQTQGDNRAPWNNNFTWQVAPASGVYNANSRYLLSVTGIGRNNRIRIRLPFDQINSTIACPTTTGNGAPSGTLEADCVRNASGLAELNIRVTNISDPEGDAVTVEGLTGLQNNGVDVTFSGTAGPFVAPLYDAPNGFNGTASMRLVDSAGTRSSAISDSYTCPVNRPPEEGDPGDPSDATGRKFNAAVCSISGVTPVSRQLTISVYMRDPDGGTSAVRVSSNGPPYAGNGYFVTSNGSFSSPGDFASPVLEDNYPTYTVTFEAQDAQTTNWYTVSTRDYFCYRPAATTTVVNSRPADLSCSIDNSGSVEPGEVVQPRLRVVNRYNLNGTLNYRMFEWVGGGSGAIIANQSIARDPFTTGTYAAGDFNTFVMPNSGTYRQTAVLNVTRIVPDDPLSVSCPGALSVYVENKPYFKVIGGDIITGNTVAGGGIKGHFNQANDAGSTAQGAILLTSGLISNIRSASYLGGAFNQLGFANEGATGTFGGDFGVPISWSWSLPDLQLDAEEFVAEPVLSGIYKIANPNLGALNIAPGTRSTLQYDGDIVIGGNIQYQNSTYYNTVREIPRLRIMASGSIYILPEVTRIDGELLAGRAIYTCSVAAPYSMNYGRCAASTLVVNGSLTAPSVYLTRLKGTLKDARTTDGQRNAAGFVNEGNIAEIINFNPEVFLQQEWGDGNTTLFDTYDSITALPPVF